MAATGAIRGLRVEPGWHGVFTRDQAAGCFPNGARVVKVQTEPGNSPPVGTQATVLGSISHPDIRAGYFVEWDGMPRCAGFVAATKLALAV